MYIRKGMDVGGYIICCLPLPLPQTTTQKVVLSEVKLGSPPVPTFGIVLS